VGDSSSDIFSSSSFCLPEQLHVHYKSIAKTLDVKEQTTKWFLIFLFAVRKLINSVSHSSTSINQQLKKKRKKKDQIEILQ